MAYKLIMDYDGTVSDLGQAIVDIAWATGWQQKRLPKRKQKISTKILKDWGLTPLFGSQNEFMNWFKIYGPAVLLVAKALPEGKNFLEHCESLCVRYKWDFVFFSSLISSSDYIYKYKACKREFGSHFANLLKVGFEKKSLFQYQDIVVDDYPKNLEAAISVGASPICIKQPHNSSSSTPAWTGPRLNYVQAIKNIEKIMKRKELSW